MGLFGTAKPMASLSSGLLARKGQARPAMKPQGYAGFGASPSLDDLGWNDMGTDAPAPAPALPPVLVQREELAAAVEAPAPIAEAAPDPVEAVASPEPVAVVPVAIEPAAVEPPTVEPAHVVVAAPVAPAAVERIGQEVRRTGKAAFTLRLPADRHLRLRLTSAVQRRSAQAVVTDALDRYLATLSEIDDLVRQCPPVAPAGDPS